MNPFERYPSETRFEAIGGGALYLCIMALIYVGIPAFLLAAFLKLVVIIYGVLPL